MAHSVMDEMLTLVSPEGIIMVRFFTVPQEAGIRFDLIIDLF